MLAIGGGGWVKGGGWDIGGRTICGNIGGGITEGTGIGTLGCGTACGGVFCAFHSAHELADCSDIIG